MKSWKDSGVGILPIIIYTPCVLLLLLPCIFNTSSFLFTYHKKQKKGSESCSFVPFLIHMEEVK